MRLRLEAIAEKPVTGYDSWSSFLDRRLQPAIRTCLSTEERQANLSASSPAPRSFCAHVSMSELESQNSNLLQTMNARARTQLRLQADGGGALRRGDHLLHQRPSASWPHGCTARPVFAVDPTIVTAAAIPVILIASRCFVRRIRHTHDDGSG